MACSFRDIADHALFCVFAPYAIERPMPVPANEPIAATIRISNMLTFIYTRCFESCDSSKYLIVSCRMSDIYFVSGL